MKTITFFMIPAFFLFSCEKNDPDPQAQEPADLALTQKALDIIHSDNEFGIAIFKQAHALDSTSVNMFVSPTSIALALAMTYNGANGDTKTAMETTLAKAGLTAEEINEGYKSLIGALKSVDQKVLMEVANSIWYKKDFTVLPDFISINQDYYDAEVSSLVFDATAKNIINAWCNDKTHGRIPEILDAIPPDAIMYLINAIYFKGIWKFEFDKSKTENEPFQLNSGSSLTVPMMKQITTVPYVADDKFMMVELPYGRGNFSMVVMLPKEGYNTDDIIGSLSQENWDTWISGMSESNVDLTLPKFTFEYKNELKDELSAMGMSVAFSSAADFSGINGTGGLCISRVIHKTFVEVNEEGTEAAAVTAVEVIETSVPGTPQNIVFRVNRPFLFAIRETTTGAILFIGRVQDPTVVKNGE
jgi:serine protease inhibitor